MNAQRRIIASCFPHFVFLPLILCIGCKQEQRALINQPPWIETQKSRYDITVAHNGESAQVTNWWDQNAWSMSEGKQFYEAYNCAGCHAQGGGAMGPALMDDKWIYGDEPYQIYASIRYGRPNGMPSFNGKIPDDEIWEITAYIRSMSGLANQWYANARDDHMKGPPPPSSVSKETPHTVSESK